MNIETHDRVAYGRNPGISTSDESHREGYVEEKRARNVIAGAGAMVVIGGLATAILAILGLVNILPLYMAAIAAIVAGISILVDSRFSAVWEATSEMRQVGSGAAIVGGLAGIVLGILALLGINAEVLLPVAVLALGAGYFLSSWGGLFSGGKILVGIAGVVLGILALAGSIPLTLSLIALLCLGCGTILSSFVFADAFVIQHA